jgi:hypothetical protein
LIPGLLFSPGTPRAIANTFRPALMRPVDGYSVEVETTITVTFPPIQ